MRARWGTGLALSAALHGLAAAALLLRGGPSGAGGAAPVPPPLHVELIQVSNSGADPAAAPRATTPAAPPVQPVPPPPDGGGELAPPPPMPQQTQAPPAARAAAQPATPAVNLGMGGAAMLDLDARSDDVLPPRPDSRHPNIPPSYPADAWRRHEAGTVNLLIHVAADGMPALVEVARSSGHPSLDEAAVRAVARWRFDPALGAAGPVPYDIPLAVNFVRDSR